MSDTAARLPARPSLEHLRKQAKERFERLRLTNPDARLADAQFALARDYGFESWPKLVQHVDTLRAADRIGLFEQLARDILAGYNGDAEAIKRLTAHFGVSYNREQLRERIQSRVLDAKGAPGEPTLADVQQMLARQYGFDTWAALAQGLAQPVEDARSLPLGLSSSPPFYSIDWKTRTINVKPPLTDRDWETIAALIEEHELTTVGSAAVTDRALERLSRLESVTALRLDGAQLLTDDGLLHLARMPQLERLDLSGWHSPLTDRGLAVLRHLTALTSFTMCWPQRISDEGAANLRWCDALQEVNLLGTPTGDGTINALRGKRALRQLTTGRLTTDAGIAGLHELPVFREWQGGTVTFGRTGLEGVPNELTIDGPFTDRGLAALRGLDGLFKLSFFWHSHAFTSDGLAALTSLPNLGALGCPSERCDDAAMGHFAAIPRLRSLMAQGAVASDDGFIALSRSRSIEHIWGRECPNLTGRGFRALANMPALRGLAVSCLQVDDAALSTLPDFPALTFLMPMDVPDAGFRHVGRCQQLDSLWCMYCRNTGDEATEHLAGLRLKLYYAGKTQITDRSLEILGRMTSLEKLEFWQTAGITDAGVQSLTTLPQLTELSISGAPRVTRAGVSAFPARVHIEYEG